MLHHKALTINIGMVNDAFDAAYKSDVSNSLLSELNAMLDEVPLPRKPFFQPYQHPERDCDVCGAHYFDVHECDCGHESCDLIVCEKCAVSCESQDSCRWMAPSHAIMIYCDGKIWYLCPQCNDRYEDALGDFNDSVESHARY